MSNNRNDFLVCKLMLLDDTHQFERECADGDSNQIGVLGYEKGPESLDSWRKERKSFLEITALN